MPSDSTLSASCIATLFGQRDDRVVGIEPSGFNQA
jgi:hypothetical protein